MCIRPQLSRKKTRNYKALTREHLKEMEEYDKPLNIGENYSSFADKIRRKYNISVLLEKY